MYRVGKLHVRMVDFAFRSGCLSGVVVLMVKVHHETSVSLRSSTLVVEKLGDNLQIPVESRLRQEATVLNGRDESLMPN